MLAAPEVAVAAGKLNLDLEVGASYDRTATLRDADGNLVNLTGCTAAAAIRDSDRDDSTELLSLTTTNGRLVLGGALGTIRILLDEEATILLEEYDGGVWDLFLRFDAATVWKVFKGSVSIAPRRTTGV